MRLWGETMKIEKLTLQAFGPFKEKAEVAFSSFGDNGIFLVTGKTGAGKTTIFDAISFALFGVASGTARSKNEMRCYHAQSTLPTVVSLEFVYKGKPYFVERTISVTSSGKKKDTASKQKPTFTAILKRTGRDTLTDWDEVNQEIEFILGINESQFRQISMLAQGEFARMLTAKSTDREEIFRKIFQTEYYEAFQRSLGIRAQRAEEGVIAQSSQITAKISDIQYPLENEVYLSLKDTIDEPNAKDIDSVISSLSGYNTWLGDQITEKNREKYLLSEKRDGQSQLISQAKSNNQLLEQREIIRKELAVLESEKEKYEQLGSVIKTARNAAVVKPYIDTYREVQDRLTKDKEVLSKDLQSCKEQMEISQKLAEQLETLKANPELEIYSKKIQDITYYIPTYEQLEKKKHECAEIEQELTTLNGKISNYNELIGKLQACISNLERTLEDISNAANSLDLNKIKKEAEENKKNQIESLQKDIKVLTDKRSEYGDIQEEYSRFTKLYNEAAEIHKALRQRFLDNQAGILARKLSDGVPCPVCGSLTHPAPAVLNDSNTISQEMVDKAEQEAIDLREKQNKASQKAGKLASIVTEKEKNIIQQYCSLFEEGGSIDSMSIRLKDELKRTKQKVKDTSALIKDAEAKIQTKETVETEISNHQVRIYEITSEIESVRANHQKLSANQLETFGEIKNIADGLPYPTKEEAEEVLHDVKRALDVLMNDITDKSNNLTNLNAEIQKLKGRITQNKENISKFEDDLDVKRSKCLYSLKKYGFDTEEICLAGYINDNLIQEKEAELNDYYKACTAKKSELSRVEKNIGDATFQNIEELEKVHNDFVAEFNQLSDAVSKLNTGLELNKKILDMLTECSSEFHSSVDNAKMLATLHATASGQSVDGKVGDLGKITFERYIQVVYFKEILKAANQHLGKMSEGRYLLSYKEPESKRNVTGLDLEIVDKYIGKGRSVSTLSGGESFMASLSLALGLSDLIQGMTGGIKMETMFIDEGFGSLDAETLDKAMVVLQQLTGSHRLIGIVSHVEALKERIDKKIVVEKLNGGKSVLKLIA